MIIFYHGSDGYRLHQAVKNLAKQYGEKHTQGLSASYIDATKPDDLIALENSLKLNSLFNETSLLIVRNFLTSNVISEQIAKILSTQGAYDSKDRVIVLMGDAEFAKTKHKSFAKLVANKKTKSQEFKSLSGSALVGWVMDEFKLRGATADPMAVQEILELTGNDSWEIIQEVEKLSNYSSSVSVVDVRALVTDRRNIGPFELVDAVGTHNASRALLLLETELTHGRDAYNILAALTSYFRALVTTQDGLEQRLSPTEIAAASGLHPFVVRKAASSGRLFKPAEVREMFDRLASLDRSLKDGKATIADELFCFLIRMGNIAS